MRLLLLLLISLAPLHAEVPPLLNDALDNWLSSRNSWTFTQFVREYDGKEVAEERLERYDLSRGESRRWELLKINGHAPTAQEEEAWSKRKNRPRKRDPKPLADYVDLEGARVVQEDKQSVTYEVPLRKTAGWIFPGEKVGIVVTIDKKSRTIEKGHVNIDGPFNVALGLARVVDLDFDLEVPPGAKGGDTAQPRGTAYAVVNKLGRRIEYSWSDFALQPASPRGN
jgi:hypothetical protein